MINSQYVSHLVLDQKVCVNADDSLALVSDIEIVPEVSKRAEKIFVNNFEKYVKLPSQVFHG